jgi:hypothetical protein
VYDSERIVEEAVGHIRKEGGRYEDLSNTMPLQPADERLRMSYFPAVSTKNDDRRRAESSTADE